MINIFKKSKNKEADKPEEKQQEQVAPQAEESAQQNSEDWTSSYEGQLAIDVYQTDDNIVIKSAIAGVSPEDINISIDNDMVTIKGERKSGEEVKEDNFYYQECYWGAFSRSVILPVDVVVDKADADLKNGILTIILPKAKKSKTTKIQVKAK